ncbi:hypothetical protein [Frankia sp. Cr1]|uniref:hypothetical protein n=1 Tax=Frankia sp. Cr1 TaxID=3073931 RepID=UPI002AD48BB8|nr:hypothetical protein [Frankia sp. Cr1]
MGLLVVVTVAGIVLTGCGSAQRERQVATAGRTPTASATAATADTVVAYVEGVRAYVKCLRADGVQVTDPDPKGRYTLEGDLGLLKSDQKFVAAQEKCHDLLPPVPSGLQDRQTRTLDEIKMARDYARCMRENGAPDFPDPGPDGYVSRGGPGEQTWDQTTDGARRATRACASIIGDPSTDGGGKG